MPTSWAELLRRSAKYAKRSLEEIAEALQPPKSPQAAPSFEPAYSRYRKRGPSFKQFSHHQGIQKRLFCSSSPFMRRSAPFFRANTKGGRGFDYSHRFGCRKSQHMCKFRYFLHYKLKRLLFCRLHRMARTVSVPSNKLPIFPFASYFNHHLPAISYASSRLNAFRFAYRLDLHKIDESAPYHQSTPSVGLSFNLAKPDLLTISTSYDPVSRFHTQLTQVKAYLFPGQTGRTFLHEKALQLQARFRQCQQERCPAHAMIDKMRQYFRLVVEPVSDSSIEASRPLNGTVDVGITNKLRPVQLIELANKRNKIPHSVEHGIRNELSALPTYRSAEGFDDGDQVFFSAAVDFDIAPRLTLPNVGELTDATLSSVQSSIDGYIKRLQSVMADVSKLAELGELPLSIEANGTALRVHFPNSDVDRVNVLLDDKEVAGGRIVEIVNPVAANDADLNDLETVSDFSSGVTTASSSENMLDEMWTHVINGAPELTMNESSAVDEPSLVTLQ